MKKHISKFFMMMAVLALAASCTEDEGTAPGSDKAPAVSVYQYATTPPNNPDDDATLRIASNSNTQAVYYFAELTSAKDARNMTDDQYAQYVEQKGTKVTLAADSTAGGTYADIVVKDLKGENTISVVAIHGNRRFLRSISFTGLEWVDVTKGTYYFSTTAQKCLDVGPEQSTILQYLKTDPTQYRFEDLYGKGYPLKMTMTKNTGKDANDDLTFLRVDTQSLPISYGSYGTISVRDIATWQNNESYATTTSLGCYMYTNKYKNNIFLTLQYSVSAGSLGYDVDSFVPAN